MWLNWVFVLKGSVKRDKEGPRVSPANAWGKQKKEAHLFLFPSFMHRNAVLRTSFSGNPQEKDGSAAEASMSASSLETDAYKSPWLKETLID